MTVLIKLTTVGVDSGPLYNLYSSPDGITFTILVTGITKTALVAGYTSTTVPNGTTIIRVLSTGSCTNYVNLTISGIDCDLAATAVITTPDPCLDCVPGEEILIGTQEWTNCNLNVTTYRDGTPIPQVTDPTAWAGLTTGAWCYYNNDSANGPTYGKLYNWYAVNNTANGGLAPLGYHIPTSTEFNTLTTFLGGETVAGGKMKEAGLCHWSTPNTDATNTSGFTGLPGGYRDDEVFIEISNYGLWWSSTEAVIAFATYLLLGYDNSNAFIYDNDKNYGFSVRLIKD
jgi:uncharacterized protein (TIGR02145 family)